MMEPSRGVMGMGGYQTQLHAPSAIFSPHYTRHHHPMYKDSNGFEVSMGMQDRPPDPQFIAEQTFHTPSFGDEEFEIPPITLPSSTTSVAQPSSGNFVQSYVEALEPSHSLGQQMDHVTSTAPTMMHYVPQGVYLRTVNEAGTMLAPATIQFQQQPRMIHHHQQQQQQQQQHCGVTSTSNLMTISQSQLSTHLGLHFTVPMAVSATSSGGSPPRSNQTSPRQETSEDSDDSAGIAHAVSLMDGWMKRPSPDPPGAKPAAKKSKVPKKKKKRDPNEPQKPVSAYALFFRDTQAAIKGQNPNASFGEVSKIVASMWDSLDDDHKNVYKKKTEAAKKEYLKALAAYRASLVSTSGSAEQADSSSGGVYGSGPAYNPPPHFATVPTTTSHSGGGNNGNGQQLSPLQKKSPLLTSLMEGSQAQPPPPLQHSPPLMITPIAHMTVNAGMPHQHQQMQGPVPTMATRSPPLGQQQQNQHQMVNQNHGVVYGQNQAMSLAHGEDGGDGARDAGQVSDGSQLCFQSSPPEPNSSGPIRCLRNGCPNQAVDSPDWDSEYCSNECVVSHCRDVFTAWVASRQTSNSYASVK